MCLPVLMDRLKSTKSFKSSSTQHFRLAPCDMYRPGRSYCLSTVAVSSLWSEPSTLSSHAVCVRAV